MNKAFATMALTGGLACLAGAQSEQTSDTLNPRDIFWSSADLAGKQPPQGATTKQTKKSTIAAKSSAATAPTSTAATPSATAGSPVSTAASGTAAEPGGHTAQVTGLLGLRYTILKALPEGGQMAVLPDTTFKAHDAIRISVESNKAGYLYIIQQGSTGTWTPLYPESGQLHKIEAGREYMVPSEPGSFEFDEHAGQERLFILLSEKPVDDLEVLIAQAQGNGKAAAPGSGQGITDVINEIRLVNRDLVFTKATKDAPSAGAQEQSVAMYVVNKNAGASRVVVDMVLKHQ